MAAFFFYTLKPTIKNYAYLFYLWAVLICFAQIYVGVHYPFDVICGAITGSAFGYAAAKLMSTKIQKI
jgi:undecaprenyl-diphosphatase